MWLKIAAGAYYLIGSAALLKSLGSHDDTARPNGGRVEIDPVAGKLGLVGTSAGLFLNQLVDSSHWTTKIPVEYHFKRTVIPRNMLDDFDQYIGYLEANHADWLNKPYSQKLLQQLGGNLPKDVEFYQVTEWWDLAGTDEQFPSTAYHRFYLDNTFTENTLAEYQALNNPQQDLQINVQSDISGNIEVGLPQQADRPDTAAQATQWDQHGGEPVTFGLIQPMGMGLWGIPLTAFFDAVDLSLITTMTPRVETTSLVDLLFFFAWDNPTAFNAKINAVKDEKDQEIEYDQ